MVAYYLKVHFTWCSPILRCDMLFSSQGPQPIAPEASEAGNLSPAALATIESNYRQHSEWPALFCNRANKKIQVQFWLAREVTCHLFQRLSLLLMRRNDDSDLNAAVWLFFPLFNWYVMSVYHSPKHKFSSNLWRDDFYFSLTFPKYLDNICNQLPLNLGAWPVTEMQSVNTSSDIGEQLHLRGC